MSDDTDAANSIADTIRKLTRAQLRAFELIAINLDKGVNPKTAAVLLEHGLIEEDEERLPGWPPVTIRRYYVPLPVHMAWCRMITPNGRLKKRSKK